MTGSSLSPQIKIAAKRQTQASGGLESAATVTRVRASTLSHYQNQNDKDHMPVDVLVDLTRDSGNPALLRYIAHACGYDLVPMGAGKFGSILKEVTEMNAAASDAVNVVAMAAEDRQITEEERAVIRDALNAARAEIDDVDNVVRHTAQDGDA